MVIIEKILALRARKAHRTRSWRAEKKVIQALLLFFAKYYPVRPPAANTTPDTNLGQKQEGGATPWDRGGGEGGGGAGDGHAISRMWVS